MHISNSIILIEFYFYKKYLTLRQEDIYQMFCFISTIFAKITRYMFGFNPTVTTDLNWMVFNYKILSLVYLKYINGFVKPLLHK